MITIVKTKPTFDHVYVTAILGEDVQISNHNGIKTVIFKLHMVNKDRWTIMTVPMGADVVLYFKIRNTTMTIPVIIRKRPPITPPTMTPILPAAQASAENNPVGNNFSNPQPYRSIIVHGSMECLQ